MYFWFCAHRFINEVHLPLTLSQGKRNQTLNTNVFQTSLVHLVTFVWLLLWTRRGTVEGNRNESKIIQVKWEILPYTEWKCVISFLPAFKRCLDLCLVVVEPSVAQTWGETQLQQPEFSIYICLPKLRIECGVLCFLFLLFQNIFLKKCYFSTDS